MIEGKLTLDLVLYDGSYVDDVVERILSIAKVSGVFAVDGADWTTVHRCKDCGTADGVRGYEDPRVTDSFGYSQMVDVWLCTPCVDRRNEERIIKPAGVTGEINEQQGAEAVREVVDVGDGRKHGDPPFDHLDSQPGEGVHPRAAEYGGDGIPGEGLAGR